MEKHYTGEEGNGGVILLFEGTLPPAEHGQSLFDDKSTSREKPPQCNFLAYDTLIVGHVLILTTELAGEMVGVTDCAD
ncbi:MAG TPA: hypothetical protein VMM54_00330 [Nitrospirota bacterium]|nr:hypothetical protein [Nitrospirota bacterium]